MTAAGYADLVSKIPAGADWIIADLIGVDPILPSIWDMVQTDLRAWIKAPEKLKAGDEQAFGFLFEGLTMSGFAMQACRKSRPAPSGSSLQPYLGNAASSRCKRRSGFTWISGRHWQRLPAPRC